MGAKDKKEAEVVEIQILTPEQIEALPAEVKTNVTFLTEVLNSSELVKLNPLVTELLEVRVANKKLVMMPLNAKGEFDKDNIQSYKDLKSKTKSLNASTGKEIKDIKEPVMKIQRGLVAIEKAIKSEIKTELESLIEKFMPYEAEVIKKRDDALAKKNAAILKAVEDAKAESLKANMQLAKTNLYNKIKYELLNANITDVSIDVSINGNKILVTETLTKITNYKYETIISELDLSILDETIQAELKEHYVKCKTNAITVLNRRVGAIDVEEQNIALTAKNEVLKETPVVAVNEIEVIAETVSSVPTPPQPKFTSIEQCIANIEFTDFTDTHGHSLENCNAWIKLKELINL
jgi:hypothetical protein